MDKADTGSYTSTVALVKNSCTGTVIALSGFIIKWTGSYIVAFWFGFTLSSIALVVFFIYRHIMRKGPTTFIPAAEVAEPTNSDWSVPLAEPSGYTARAGAVQKPIIAAT